MENFETVIKGLQCVGCASGDYPTCFAQSSIGIGCKNHVAGTMVSSIGRIFLGLPKGFNRLGECDNLKLFIFENQAQHIEQCSYDKWNVPVWKYQYGNYVLVRGFMPRLNKGFLHIILDGQIGEIKCYEVTESDIDAMD